MDQNPVESLARCGVAGFAQSKKKPVSADRNSSTFKVDWNNIDHSGVKVNVQSETRWAMIRNRPAKRFPLIYLLLR